ncbi:MAG: hypothetical protein DRJ68_06760 [Thermoprotei archaeon]|nr:MAG: hypothetical protein DRJ62_04415 [Thermoprotei archaeon]RLF18526.1 MAG: hypothetical protein DRJ68_06760 [Thermoprotei archaeon]
MRCMNVKAVVVNIDSALLKVDVSADEVAKRIKNSLGVEGGLESLVAEAYIKSSRGGREAEAIDGVVRELELETASRASVDQEDLEALCTLKAIGVKVAAVTMRCRETAEVALSRAGLQGFFDVLVTRDDEPDKVSQILLACSKLECSAREVMYVGFSRADALAGIEAGCLTATPYRGLMAVRVSSLRELLDVYKFI